MSYGYGFPPYVSVAEKKAEAAKNLAKLKKKNPNINPIIIESTKIAKTWWGKAWNDNLESYADFANRIGRGRSYVRHGAVLDLQITEGSVTALVQGSVSKPYEIKINIKPLPDNIRKKITDACEGKLDSLQELLEGKFPEGLAELFTAHGKGLFPSPKEISLDCSCPDWAEMCKHVAAALYGVGARLDNDPALFFVLRKVKVDDLISKAITQESENLLKRSQKKSSRVIEDVDVSAMFGIEMETGEPEATEKAGKKAIAKKTTVKKVTEKKVVSKKTVGKKKAVC